jgi:hypothetical protein
MRILSTTSASIVAAALAAMLASPASAGPAFFFSTGDTDGKIAADTRPGSAGKFEIETGDDFVLTGPTSITSATFTGLLTGGATLSDIGNVRVEIYRVFPNDSNVARTSGPPTFSTPNVPTRVNSPSDVALAERDLATATLSVTAAVLQSGFTANNSVLPGGIHPKPGQTTGGNGPVTGDEVEFSVTISAPLNLSPGHYFFVPQVQVTAPNGEFLWLSAPRPIVPPGTPFPPGSTDLQAWTRDANLDPDWLRIGTDIVGLPATGGPAPTFNETFSLAGTIAEPPALTLLLAGLPLLALARRRG